MADNRFLQSPFDKLIEDAQSYELPQLSQPEPISTTQHSTAPEAPKAPKAKKSASNALKTTGLLPPQDLAPIFEEAAATFGVPLNVLAALGQQESSYRTDAIGEPTKYGRAKGIMQYIPPTAQALGINPFDPRESIFAAAKQFRERLDAGESIQEAIAHHHSGPDRKQWGPKTREYIQTVMGKAGTIGDEFMKNAPKAKPAFDPAAIQAELDAKEPGRFKVLTPEEVEAYQRNEAKAFPVNDGPGLVTSGEAKGKDGFFSATGKALQNVPQNFKNSAGGLIRNFGEGIDDQSLVINAKKHGIIDRMRERGDLVMKPTGLSEMPLPYLKDGRFGDTSVVAAYIREHADELMSPEEAANLIGMKPNAISRYGKEVSDEARKAMVEINPDGPLAKYGSMTIGSIAEMLPAMTAAIVTKNPATAMGIMGGQVYGQSYDRAREAGENPEQAGAYAMAQALAEAIPSALPVHVILKPGQQLFSGVLKAGAAEAVQEAITGAIQAGIDKGTIDPNMTWEQARQQIIDSAIVGFGAGGTMRAGVHGLEKLTQRNAQGTEQAQPAPSEAAPTTAADGATPMESTPPTQGSQTTPTATAATTPAAQTPEQVQAAPVTPSNDNAAPALPEGPLSRAAQNATQTQGAERVVVQTPAGTVTGTVEAFEQGNNGSWSARVMSDDGTFYEFTDKDGVELQPEGYTAPVEEAVPATETVEAETETVEPQGETVQAEEVAEAPVQAPVEPVAVEPVATEEVTEIEEAPKAEAVEPAEVKVEPRYEDMSEDELRARLKYIASQAKANGGWNKRWMEERRKVEKAINALTAKKAEPVTAVQEVAQQKPAEQAPEVAQAEQQPVKWFGTQEKADAFIAKKKLAETHEVVPVSRNRFEIREKVAAAEEAALPKRSPETADPQQVGLSEAKRLVEQAGGKVISEGSRPVWSAANNESQDAEVFTVELTNDKGETVRVPNMVFPINRAEFEKRALAMTAGGNRYSVQAGTVEPGQSVELGKGRHSGTVVDVTDKQVRVKVGDSVENMTHDQFKRRVAAAERASAEVESAGSDATTDTATTEPTDDTASRETGTENVGNDSAADKPEDFVRAPDGSIDFGELTEEQLGGWTPGKIRLQQGNESWGLRHIEARHGKEIRAAGFDSVEAFVADITRNMDQVWRPAKTRQLVALHRADKKDRVMFVEMQPGRDEAGDFYTVKTAFPARPNYTKKEGWKLLWEVRAQTPDASGERPSFAVSPQAVAGGEVTIPSSQSSDQDISANPSQDNPGQVDNGTGTDNLSNPRSTVEVENDAEQTQADNRADRTDDEPGRVQENESQREATTVRGNADGRVRAERGGRERGNAEQRSDRTGEHGKGQQDQQLESGDRADGTRPSGREDQRNYRIQPGELNRTGSWKATAEQNVRIVELVKRLMAEGRQATAEEKALLTKFTGWGASEIANGIFPNQYGQYKDASWKELGERLKATLTPEEYAQAKRTTQYAHYTSEPVIRSVYSALNRMGFNGGQVLEPGMGVGLFNGLMPDSIAQHSTYTGVEYDTITGNIAKLLYPESNVIVGDFTQTKLPRDFFDAAIGNPPFGQIKIQADPEYKKQGFLLHDYFFAKTIDRVKPGGLLVFVTSKGTMDKASDRARKYLAERADLMGAIRLPQTAFKGNAGTEVVTDVIFLRKRAPGQEPSGEAWQGLAEVQTAQGPAMVNEYFARHPEMVLGRHAKTGSMYRADEYTVEPIEGDIEELFAKAVENLPENVYRPERGSQAEAAAVQRRDYDPKVKKEGGVYVADDGALMVVEDGQGVPLTERVGSNGKPIALKPREIEWLGDYSKLRDALKQAQYDQLNDGPWETSLEALNERYDAFVKKHGPILAHSVTERENDDGSVTVIRRFKNQPLFLLDAEGALVHALESINTDGTISKGPVLNGRTLNKPTTPKITNTRDAMFVSLNDVGRFDLSHIAKLAGKTEDEVISELGDAIYEDPANGWTTADDYLSGNVVRKLKEAQSAARLDKKYQRNVEALKNVQPRALAPQDITVQLGSAWVPASDVQNFASEVLGERFTVKYNPVTAQWSVDGYASSASEWGTGDKKADVILEAVLNNRQLKVTYKDAEGKTHTDAEGTEKVNDIAKKMRAAFKRWIWTDTNRADRLAKFYNENYNNIAPRKFDGSHLTLPGVSSRFQLRPHQKRAIWRTIQQGDTYYAHAVGAGKTFTMIAAGMEERRLGLVKKPMYVVPNHMLAQFSKEFLELYPTASIMVADEQNFHTHNRRKFVAQAALNDPDAIVITHSAFGRIGMSRDFSERFISDQIDEWKFALDETDKSDRVTRKQIERRIEQLENRLKGIIDGDKKDQVLSFEELGVDRLYVDEGHEFRKLDFPTNRGNIKGVDPSGSQRAMDLFMKVQYLREKNPNRALVMASGTPVTNTMGELFTVQRYFQPQQLAEDGDNSFDAWANHYGEVVDGLEQNAAGGYETVSRFAKFVNVPELMSRVRSFMDILTSEQLGDLVQRPNVEKGGRQVVVTPSPDGYKAYQKQLEARIKAIRNRKGPPKAGEDIILNVIADGRFSAIDMRFVDPSLPSDPNSKLNRILDDMIETYHATAQNEYATDGKVDPLKGSSIMLFTDIGLGEQSAKNRGFDMKAWIEKRLIEGGVKPEHIAFMRDNKAHAKKERLFDDLRQGRKRILIGGKDMETGVNAQKRLKALYHLDAPWFPASVEQREGRIIRQGNQNKEVAIRAYATKGSYDSTMWGMNARKARFIEQAMSGDTSVRSMEDVSEASAFEMAAALASGDERYLKLAGLKADVDRLSRLYSAHLDEQRRLRSEKMGHESSIKFNREQVAKIKDAIAKRQPIKAGEFAGKVGKKSFDKREDFSKALFDEFKGLAESYTAGEKVIGEIGGFNIVYNGVEMRGGNFAADVTLDIPGDPDALIVFPIDPEASVQGIATRAANQVNGLDNDLLRRERYIASHEGDLEKINRRLGAAFPEMSELNEKRDDLQELEAELEAESQAANADAAAATVEVEGEQKQAEEAADNEEPRYSVMNGETQGEFGPIFQAENAADAINRLMSDKTGEAIINKPGVGDISLVYGDSRFGLDHIARRRGEDFLKRLPDLIQNGEVYTKPGQTTRLFIGNARDEAALSLQWDGKAKTWLVSAYEKYPDLKPADAFQVGRRSQVVEERTDNKPMSVEQVRRAITRGPFGLIVDKMVEKGLIVIHRGSKSLPSTLGRGKRGVQAVTAPDGKIHMVASNLRPNTANAVLLHELFHSGTERLVGSKRWGELMGRLGSLYRQSEQSTGRAREFFDRARARVESAKRQGAVSRRMEVEEFGAYAIEEYESAPRAIRKWVDDLIGAIKAFLFSRYGVQLGQVTPAQLRALAKDALITIALDKRGQLFGPIAERFSVNEEGGDIHFSVLPDETALADATKALDEAQTEQYKPDFIGQLQKDIGRIARFLLHPRQIAALHEDFAPVYRTAVDQFEMRDSIIDELQQDHKAYDVLPQKSKERVNAVLELGRLMSQTYSEKALRDGVVNTGERSVVKFTEGGSSYRAKEKIKTLLSAEGEVIKLSDEEIEAYHGLRRMFDNALDKFKDQTLADFGLPEFAGQKDAAKAIMELAAEAKTEAKKERLEGIARFVQEIEQAKRTGYVPFARYGDYVVAVKEQKMPLKIIKDPDGGWLTRDLPSVYEKFLEDIGAKYDELEGGYRLDANQRQALIKENEQTINSVKVEFTAKDKALIKLGRPVDELPSVKKALEEAQKIKGNNPARRVVAFEVIQKKPEGGMKLSDVDALAEVAMLDTETWDAVRDQLADAIKGRSFRKHFFQADNVPGYTADFERSIADYMAGMAGYLSRRHYNSQWDNAVSAIKAPRLFDYASKYRAYANEPQEELAMLRQIGFFHYIAGVPATALVNLTQPFIMTAPVLSQIAPMHMVVREMSRAYKDALAMIRVNKRVGLDFFDPNKAPADIRADLLKGWAEGMFVPLQTYEVMATARNRNVGGRRVARAFNKTVQATAALFSFAERLNRLVTFIASARLAAKPGVKARAKEVYGKNALARQTMLRNWSASSVADFMIDETQFRMGKANRPNIMRGLGAVIMQFKGFVMQSLEAWFRLATQNGKQGAKAVALSIGAMLLIGGLWGFPGGDDLRDLIEKAYKQVTKQDLDLKTELRKGLYDVTGQRWIAEVASKGATYPFGLDLSRVGMGNISPDSPLQVFGIPADLFIGRPTRAFQKASGGDGWGAAAEFLPNFLKNPVTAYGWTQGGVRDGAGRLLLDEADVGAEEVSMKSMGFQPSRITDVRDYEYAQRRMETANDALKRDYISRLAKTIATAEKHPEKAAEAMEKQAEIIAEIEEHNAKARGPEELIVITKQAMKERVRREMGGVQETWGRERKQARGASEDLREVFGLTED